MNNPYALSDSQWELVAKLLPESRKRKYSLRLLFTAVVFVVKEGIQWRALPKGVFPPWQVVYYYFRKWSNNSIFSLAIKTLSRQVRIVEGRDPNPRAAVIDSQSVKTGAGVESQKGWDNAKKFKGRKRHLLTDTMGLPIAVRVSSAEDSDRQGLLYFKRTIEHESRLQTVFADQAYWGIQLLKVPVSIVSQQPKAPRIKGAPPLFKVLPKRWVIERTFGWLSNYRRLNRDYEKRTDTAKTLIEIALVNILSKRLSRKNLNSLSG
jgi:putative transposase